MQDRNWFSEAKYGLFIHWGIYSILAGVYKGIQTDRIAEWIENTLNIPVEEYEQLAREFNPMKFDPDDFVRRAKEDWGMRYIVITAKHHDGFAMYGSKCSPFNVVSATPYGKDIFGMLAESCRKHDMRLGFYYSQAQDWDDPDGFKSGADNSNKNFRRYLDEKCIPQLKELLTGYGKIAIIWFDTPMGIKEEESRELVDLVRELQPDSLISGRIGNRMGDYMTTADNNIPRLPVRGLWEVPATVNSTWGYNQFDNSWKKPKEILRILLKITARGGNYLLNVGPTAEGLVPEACVRILDEVGLYLKENPESVYGTKRMPVYLYDLEGSLRDLEMTCRDFRLYIHVLEPRVRVELLNIANTVTNAYRLSDHRELKFTMGKVCEGDNFIEIDFPEDLQKEKNFCICLELLEKDLIFEEIVLPVISDADTASDAPAVPVIDEQ